MTVLHGLHDLVDDVDAQATRANIVEVAGANRIEVGVLPPIKHLYEGFPRQFGSAGG